MNISANTPVQSPIGKKTLDSTGSAVCVTRMNPEKVYLRVSDLIQDYINNGDEKAWRELRLSEFELQ